MGNIISRARENSEEPEGTCIAQTTQPSHRQNAKQLSDPRKAGDGSPTLRQPYAICHQQRVKMVTRVSVQVASRDGGISNRSPSTRAPKTHNLTCQGLDVLGSLRMRCKESRSSPSLTGCSWAYMIDPLRCTRLQGGKEAATSARVLASDRQRLECK